MELTKVFSGSEILALAVQKQIEAEGINAIIKDNIRMANISGFGSSDLAVDVLVEESELEKVQAIIAKSGLADV